MTTDSRLCGLRERKKANTTAALVAAAYELVGEGGMGAVTAEAVAERAGVSRRTFFNYFPNVDDVFVRGLLDILAEVGDRLEARPADEPLMDVLDQMVASSAESALLERIALLGLAGTGSPHVRSILSAALHDWLGWLVGFIGPRRSAGTDELYAVNLATAVIAAAQAALLHWAEHRTGPITPESVTDFQHLMTRSLRYLRTGFDTPA